MKIKGLNTHRFKNNPEERKFAEAWDKLNERVGGHASLLDQLLDAVHATTCDGHDEVVAATVIQWLGSPVGQSWLEQLGYEKKK